MTEEKVYTEAEAERFFAIEYNGITWNLLEKEDRSAEEDALMVHVNPPWFPGSCASCRAFPHETVP